MNIVLHEEYFHRFEDVLRRLRLDANALAVFLIDKDGQQIAAAGEVEGFDSQESKAGRSLGRIDNQESVIGQEEG